MEAVQLLRDPMTKPIDEVIADTLGDAYGVYDVFLLGLRRMGCSLFGAIITMAKYG